MDGDDALFAFYTRKGNASNVKLPPSIIYSFASKF